MREWRCSAVRRRFRNCAGAVCKRRCLRERMRYAYAQGCDLAMMVAEPGSNSQRNAERKGFRIAYTRTKWHRLMPGIDTRSRVGRE